MSPVFWQSPDPAVVGQPVTIGFNMPVPPGIQFPFHGTINWVPQGQGGHGFILETDGSTHTFTFPDGATGATIEDASGSIPPQLLA